jgi:hypothetical protein
MHNNNLLRHHGLTLVPSQRHLIGFFIVMQVQGVMLEALVANSQPPFRSVEQIARIIKASRAFAL